jgi:SagB-type dehydrogenase family enzyme
MTATLPDLADVDPFDRAELLSADLVELARRHGLADGDAVQAMLGLLGALVATPNTVFDTPPEYVRPLPAAPAAELPAGAPVRSGHNFFDVLSARASRRDFGSDSLDLPRLLALLHWTVGKRAEAVAYDFRDAPMRYVPSAGGLSSVDAYVIVNAVTDVDPGAYYFDHGRGLVPVCAGHMIQKIADLNPGQSWLTRASALVVFVANTGRVEHKYGAMGFKLIMLDAGAAAGHAELVAAALELRSTILGGLPPAELARLLRVDGRTRVPVAALALGTRTGRG